MSNNHTEYYMLLKSELESSPFGVRAPKTPLFENNDDMSHLNQIVAFKRRFQSVYKLNLFPVLFDRIWDLSAYPFRFWWNMDLLKILEQFDKIYTEFFIGDTLEILRELDSVYSEYQEGLCTAEEAMQLIFNLNSTSCSILKMAGFKWPTTNLEPSKEITSISDVPIVETQTTTQTNATTQSI